jgi:uncharacterized protein (DUF58 family)
MRGIRINLLAVCIYLFGFFVFYLAGSYMGILFSILFYSYLLIPLVSAGYLFYSFAKLRYHQKFSTERPVKGEEVIYTLNVSNESFLPVLNILIKFKVIQPGHNEQLKDLSVYLKKQEEYSKDFTIRCPYRGIYSVGLDSLELQDVFGWFTISMKVWHRDFYVHPRIIEVVPVFSEYNKSTISIGTFKGSVRDNTLLNSLKVYRPGESVRHMFWKKLISTGSPFLKTYEQTACPGIDIYLDLRREKEPDPLILTREDCSLEIVVALVKYFLDNSINTAVRCYGEDEYLFLGAESSEFTKFHQSTLNIYFKDTISPLVLFNNDRAERKIISNFILFVTHIFDPEILEYAVEFKNSSINVIVIVNQTGMTEQDRNLGLNYIKSIRERGGYVLLVDGPGTIKRDLER